MYLEIFSHQSFERRMSCSTDMKNSEETSFSAVSKASKMPCPGFGYTFHPMLFAISTVLSVLWSSMIIFFPTTSDGMTSAILLRTRGKSFELFLVHITMSTLSTKALPLFLALLSCITKSCYKYTTPIHHPACSDF